MRSFILILVMSVVFLPVTAKQSRAYDMDCAIILCMAGGFPSSSVCAAAYAEMIRRITPWPVRPPFGICTFAAVPVELGGPGGEGELDISIPEYAWLRRTRVYWFRGAHSTGDDGDDEWNWSVRSCDHENSNCSYLIRVFSSSEPWPRSFVSENGKQLNYPSVGQRFVFTRGRAVMVEFSDFQGNLGSSEWYSY